MVVTDYTKERIAIRLGSDVAFPLNFVIGAGSTAATVSDVTLVSESDKQVFTLFDVTVKQKISFQGDWNSVEMSGIQLAEWGITANASASTGSVWARQAFIPLTFDGTNELQISETWEVF